MTTKGTPTPGKLSELQFDLDGQKSKVALLAVDKAIYALHANNKLTGKKVKAELPFPYHTAMKGHYLE